METEKFEIWAMEYVSGNLDAPGQNKFEDFLKDHFEFQEQFEGIKETWQRLNMLNVPSPSEKMDQRFYGMLHNEIGKAENTMKGSGNKFWSFLESVWRPQLAFGMLLLAIGFGLGYFLNSNETEVPLRTTVVHTPETEEVRQRLVLTLLDQPSANQRLQGINEANKIPEVDKKVIQALLRTLDNDPNVNVRLAAIESLTNYLDNATVREGLVQSIVKQDSPIVQVTLADLMVALQEKKSVEPFKQLMRLKELHESVRQKLETSIASIL